MKNIMWKRIAKKILEQNPLYWYDKTIGDVLEESKNFTENHPAYVECESCGCLLKKEKKYFSHYETEKIPNLQWGSVMIIMDNKDKEYADGYTIKPKEIYYCKKCKPKK